MDDTKTVVTVTVRTLLVQDNVAFLTYCVYMKGSVFNFDRHLFTSLLPAHDGSRRFEGYFHIGDASEMLAPVHQTTRPHAS
jgi:hypothetical protein